MGAGSPVLPRETQGEKHGYCVCILPRSLFSFIVVTFCFVGHADALISHKQHIRKMALNLHVLRHRLPSNSDSRARSNP